MEVKKKVSKNKVSKNINKNSKKKVQKPSKPVVDRKETDKKVLQTKLNRVIGQLNGIKKMIDDGRVSEDLLMQLCAAESGLEALKFMLYKEVAINKFNEENIKEINQSLDEILMTIKRY